MTIRGRIGSLLAKVLRIKGYKMRFIFSRARYDSELTKLAFLNQSLADFDEGVALFRKEVIGAIQKENTSNKEANKWTT